MDVSISPSRPVWSRTDVKNSLGSEASCLYYYDSRDVPSLRNLLAKSDEVVDRATGTPLVPDWNSYYFYV